MSKAVRKKRDDFQSAVENTPDVADGYRVGLQALGKYSKLIALGDNAQCNGSLDIDSVTTHRYPRANRWDYAFSYKGEVYFVEVHSAETSEVSTVIRKLQWLKDWLVSHAPLINDIKAKKLPPYYWLQSGRFSIQRNSPQYRQVIKAGIKPIPALPLN